MSVDSTGTIAFANTLTSSADLSNATKTTITGTADSAGGCDFSSSPTTSAANSVSSYTEETSFNPTTCTETLVTGTLTAAGTSALDSYTTTDTATAAAAPTSDTTTTAATTTTSAASSDATAAATAGTWEAFDKTSYVDPLDITITSLTNNLTWSGNGKPASNGGKITKASAGAVSYKFAYDNWTTSGFSWSWSGCVGCNSVTARVARTYYNSDFEAVIVALFGVAGYAACGFNANPATFYLQPATVGYPNGYYGWGWNSHVSGGCSDLVHFRENRGGGHSS